MTFSLFIWWTNREGEVVCKKTYTNLRQITDPQTLSHQFVQTDWLFIYLFFIFFLNLQWLIVHTY
jgi:hypothetical protein